MSRTPTTSPSLAYAAVAIVALALGALTWYLTQPDAPAARDIRSDGPQRIGPLLALPEAKPVANFALTDHRGQAFSLDDLKGNWSLVFFGFASCPHICPDTLYQMQVARQVISESDSVEAPQLLLISVDPERDTPEQLAEYLSRFEPGMEAATGDDAQLRALAFQLGVHYNVPEHQPGEWYNVDHSMDVVVLDEDGAWAGMLSAPHDGRAMGEALVNWKSGRGPVGGQD